MTSKSDLESSASKGIEEQLRQNSQDSSKSPSQDEFGQKAPEVKEKSKKKRGGQPGHPGAQTQLYKLSVGMWFSITYQRSVRFAQKI